MNSDPYIPTPEDFKRAEQAVAERHASLDEASQAALDHLQPQYPIAHLQLFPHREADFHAYVFFETDAQVAASESDGSRNVIEDAVYTAIANAGKGTRPGISIHFEYDSEQNVKENFEGSYHLRMR